MPTVVHNKHNNTNDRIIQAVLDISKYAFQFSIVFVCIFYGYLLYGLFTGQLVNVPHMPAAEKARILGNIDRDSLYLNISLMVFLVSACIQYYELVGLGYAFVAIAAVLAYGLPYSFQTVFASEASHYITGDVSQRTLREIGLTGIFCGIAGIAIILRYMIFRVLYGRFENGANVTLGAQEKRNHVSTPLIAGMAACWQLPFCGDHIRPQCPIFKARTKCWKQKTGCMCERDILITSLPKPDANAPKGHSGFVPLSDLMVENDAKQRAQIPTRSGPRGVRLPLNPNLTPAQKNERCRNCIIYNEHQRHKYQLLAPFVTLVVPLLVYLRFDEVRIWLAQAMGALDSLFSHISFSATTGKSSDLLANATGGLPVELILICCLTLVAMTWMLRVLEYCIFKIKI